MCDIVAWRQNKCDVITTQVSSLVSFSKYPHVIGITLRQWLPLSTMTKIPK